MGSAALLTGSARPQLPLESSMKPPPQPYSLRDLYDQRFQPLERQQKNELWKVLCQSFFQKFVSNSDTVVDLGAGYCEFINNIRCARKFAVDLNEETLNFAAEDVKVVLVPVSDLSAFEDGSIDVTFCSNLFEHLQTKEELLAVLSEVCRILRVNGRLLVLQPNIHYAYREYWDYFDHYLPLSHLSLTEALHLSGFSADLVRPRFLPYTFKSRLPKSPRLLRIYLRLPVLQAFVGKQMFLVASKR